MIKDNDRKVESAIINKGRNEWSGPLQHVHPVDIHVRGEIGRRIELTNIQNLLKLDYDRDFLRPYQQRIPHPSQGKVNESDNPLYIGLGENIDAIVFMAAHTGNPEIIKLKDYLIEAIIRTQDKDGYIGLFEQEPDNEQLYKRYTWGDIGFIALALANNYRFFDNTLSRDSARLIVRFMVNTCRQNPPERSVIANEFSIPFYEMALEVYRITGDGEILQFIKEAKLGCSYAINVAKISDWDDDLFQAGWHAPRAGTRSLCHVYRYLDRMYSQLLLNRIEPSDKYTHMARKFYTALVRREKSGMVITGAIGKHEGWWENQDGSEGLGETCVSVYSTWFFEEMINLDEDLRYGDIMERIIYNHLFAAQSPEGRHLRYFTPFSGTRPYYSHDTYCCPGTFRRGISRLPLHVYYQFKEGIAINLYSSSDAVVQLASGMLVKIKQETCYPTDGSVEITVTPSQPVVFPLYLRLPRWCKRPIMVVNDEPPLRCAAVAVIKRQWKDGDRIRLSLPMSWRLIKGRELQANRVAVMRGPVVFCLNRTFNHLPKEMKLRDITIDPTSLGEPYKDDRIRPDGMAVRVMAWSPGMVVLSPPDLELILSEFPDPDGEEIYFYTADIDSAEDDELIE